MKDMSPQPDDDLTVPYLLLLIWLALIGLAMLGICLLEEAPYAPVYC